jgi:hypothetical protein
MSNMKFVVVGTFSVPEITPVDAFSVKPVGSVPFDTEKVFGPFVATIVVVYAAPFAPAGKGDVVVIVGGPKVTLKFSVCVFDDGVGFDALKLHVVVCTVLGVPEITPVPAASDNPVGKQPGGAIV